MMDCEHTSFIDGPIVPLPHGGSYKSQICVRCHSWRTVTHLGLVNSGWRPKETLAEAASDSDEEPIATNVTSTNEGEIATSRNVQIEVTTQELLSAIEVVEGLWHRTARIGEAVARLRVALSQSPSSVSLVPTFKCPSCAYECYGTDSAHVQHGHGDCAQRGSYSRPGHHLGSEMCRPKPTAEIWRAWSKACDIEKAVFAHWCLTQNARATCVVLGVEPNKRHLIAVLEGVRDTIDANEVEYEIALINRRVNEDGSEKVLPKGQVEGAR